MRIGQLAKRTGLSRDTIRFYERHGLIESLPSTDPANSFRNYPEGLVERLGVVVEARDAGLSIADLQLLTRCLEGATMKDGQLDFDADAFIDGKIEEVERVILRSRNFLKLLKQTRSALNSLE